ncbi:hypothetical protein AVEN_255154-1 [Araneus ventricosus]|uniref:Uncharacterized protein n=1 Tax=Araneus ventricosus TaxID=182803 RepID=A0A4Y2BAC4_ARAVE|nr:hypothetical protein AVEN_255154-1 [Araneus ventricosus]
MFPSVDLLTGILEEDTLSFGILEPRPIQKNTPHDIVEPPPACTNALLTVRIYNFLTVCTTQDLNYELLATANVTYRTELTFSSHRMFSAYAINADDLL